MLYGYTQYTKCSKAKDSNYLNMQKTKLTMGRFYKWLVVQGHISDRSHDQYQSFLGNCQVKTQIVKKESSVAIN